MRLLLALAMTLLLGLNAAWAGEAKPFNQPDFDAAQAQDKPILIEIHASWCPVCGRQKPVLSRLRETEYTDLVAFTVDFDSQKDLVTKFGARSQSTLIVFRGKNEKGRNVGVSDPAALKELVQRAYAG